MARVFLELLIISIFIFDLSMDVFMNYTFSFGWNTLDFAITGDMRTAIIQFFYIVVYIVILNLILISFYIKCKMFTKIL